MKAACSFALSALLLYPSVSFGQTPSASTKDKEEETKEKPTPIPQGVTL